MPALIATPTLILILATVTVPSLTALMRHAWLMQHVTIITATLYGYTTAITVLTTAEDLIITIRQITGQAFRITTTVTVTGTMAGTAATTDSHGSEATSPTPIGSHKMGNRSQLTLTANAVSAAGTDRLMGSRKTASRSKTTLTASLMTNAVSVAGTVSLMAATKTSRLIPTGNSNLTNAGSKWSNNASVTCSASNR